MPRFASPVLFLLIVFIVEVLAADPKAFHGILGRSLLPRQLFVRNMTEWTVEQPEEGFEYDLMRRQGCPSGTTSCPDGCIQGTNDNCCPVGGLACDSGEACCGTSGCVPLDGSVCCADSHYCPPGLICGSYDGSGVCCIDSACQFIQEKNGGTFTVTSGMATVVGTGATTTVAVGAGVTTSTPPTSTPPTSTSASPSPTTTSTPPASASASPSPTTASTDTANPTSAIPATPSVSSTAASPAVPQLTTTSIPPPAETTPTVAVTPEQSIVTSTVIAPAPTTDEASVTPGLPAATTSVLTIAVTSTQSEAAAPTTSAAMPSSGSTSRADRVADGKFLVPGSLMAALALSFLIGML